MHLNTITLLDGQYGPDKDSLLLTMYTANLPRKVESLILSLTMCDQQIWVCKVFFLETLDIKEDTVYGACQKKDSSGIVTHDGRGRHKKT